MAAYRLLCELEPNVPNIVHVKVKELPSGLYGRAEGGWIWISSASPWYERGRRGDVLPLSALLHHEHLHCLRDDTLEQPFARATLAFLRRHQAGANDIAAAERRVAVADIDD
jgi:hypothetical protein